MDKKYIRKKRSTLHSTQDEDEVEEAQASNRMLKTIHQKLDNSPALNGGFDILLYKIDGIEKSQGQIVEKVDKIHEAIYHPDEGLFARIAPNKASQIESLSKVEKDIIEIETWKNQREEDGEDCEKENDEFQHKLTNLEKSLNDVVRFQSLIFSALKWLAAAVGGAVISFFAKKLM